MTISNRKAIFAVLSLQLLSLCCSLPAHAGVYKWVDDAGQVHYGERPGNNDARKLTIRTNETTKPRKLNTSEDAEQADTNQQAAESGDEDQAAAPPVPPPEPEMVPKPIPKKEKRQLCQQARSDVTAISNRGRMREMNSKGEYVYLTESQRQQRLNTAKKNVKQYCK